MPHLSHRSEGGIPRIDPWWDFAACRLFNNLYLAHAISVDSRFATAHDTARILGVSKSRTEALIKIARRYTERILQRQTAEAGQPVDNRPTKQKSATTVVGERASKTSGRDAGTKISARKSEKAKVKRYAGSGLPGHPYDKRFENQRLAYIAGISAFGFAPRATLEIQNSANGARSASSLSSLPRNTQFMTCRACHWTKRRRELLDSICRLNSG